jgi:4-diphosphocytidyl-2C-methyl-D-erythritol kinase
MSGSGSTVFTLGSEASDGTHWLTERQAQVDGAVRWVETFTASSVEPVELVD